MSEISQEEKNTLQFDFVKSFNTLGSVVFLENLFNSFPVAVAIANENRQIIFANNAMVNNYGYATLEEMLGHRPGEALSCLHTSKGIMCGSNESCKVCGAFISMNNSLNSNEITTNEFRLTRKVGNRLQSHEYNITVTPLKIIETSYLILFINETTHEKRRKSLERIFFHDVMNKVSSLNGFCQLMQREKNISRIEDHLKVSSTILKDLSEEILAQRQLTAAENGELVANRSVVNIPELIQKIIIEFENQPSKKTNIIFSNNLSNSQSILTDPTLLNRVISNLLKNALEASNKGDTISIFTTSVNEMVTIAMHNPSFITYDNQLHIFQRSFSTKGEGRGLGTYSIRLITEQYLNGIVRFSSSPQEGTTFFIELPPDLK